MIDYDSFSLRTLRHMCRGQFLRATPSNGLSPTRQDYINTLKATAAPPQNSFLTLPGELRNMIYREMLIFRDHNPQRKPSCSSQILRCNRQINAEATNILYEENVFVVELSERSLLVHGDPCGWYSPWNSYWHRRSGPTYSTGSVGNVRWPALLLRAHSICFKIGSVSQDPALVGSFKMDVNRILYSLCSFLSTGSSLAKVEVDLRWPNNNISTVELGALCYPLIMLGELASLVIRTTDTNTIRFTDSAYTNPLIPNSTHVGSALAPALALAHEAKVYKILADAVKVGTSEHSLNFFQVPYPPGWARLFSAMDAVLNLVNNHHSQLFAAAGRMDMFDGAWERNMRRATNDLRQAFTQLNFFELLQNSGSGYGDLMERLHEWRIARWNLRAKAGKVGAAAAIAQAQDASMEPPWMPATQEELQELIRNSSQEEVYENFNAQGLKGSLASPLALLVLSRKKLRYSGLPGELEYLEAAKVLNSNTEWLPPSEEEEDGATPNAGIEGSEGDDNCDSDDDSDHVLSDHGSEDSLADQMMEEFEHDQLQRPDEMDIDHELPDVNGGDQGKQTGLGDDQTGNDEAESSQAMEEDDKSEMPRRSERRRVHRNRSISPIKSDPRSVPTPTAGFRFVPSSRMPNGV